MAAMDQSKLQTAAGSSLQAAGKAASGVATPAARSDSSAWKKQRPGATFFEKLQVRNAVLDAVARGMHNQDTGLVCHLVRLPPICMVASKKVLHCAWHGHPVNSSIFTACNAVIVWSAVAKYVCCHATRHLLSAAAMAMKHVNMSPACHACVARTCRTG